MLDAEVWMIRQLKVKRWDEGNSWVAAKWFFVTAILGIGVVTGQFAFLHAEVAELHHITNKLLSMNQGYGFNGQTSPESSEPASWFADADYSRVARTTLAIPGRFGNKPCD